MKAKYIIIGLIILAVAALIWYMYNKKKKESSPGSVNGSDFFVDQDGNLIDEGDLAVHWSGSGASTGVVTSGVAINSGYTLVQPSFTNTPRG